MGAQTRMVPRLVPVAVATRQVMRKAAATYPPPETAAARPSLSRSKAAQPLPGRAIRRPG